MKLYYFILTFVAIVSVSTLGNASEVNSDVVLSASEYWPLKVTVHKDVVGEMHGNIVEGGKEWDFLRIQDGRCLVDMGHNGIFRFDSTETDIRKRIESNMKEWGFPRQGLFAYRYTKSFYDPKTKVALRLGDLDQYDYFILFYFDYDQDTDAVQMISNFLVQYKEISDLLLSAQPLLIPEDNIIATGVSQEYLEGGLTAPTAVPYMRLGLLHTLQHNPGSNGNLVIVDKNGQMLGNFLLSNFDDAEQLMDAIHNITSPGERALERVSPTIIK